jgi:hypothetical protein
VAHAQRSGLPDTGLASSGIDRRRLLFAGAACCVPLVAGAAISRASSAWAAMRPAQASDANPILDHIGRELVGIYHGMQGAVGIKGEHVRALAANLDLMAAELVQSGHDTRVQAALREGTERLGPDAFARELSARHQEAAIEMARRCGLARRVPEDLAGTAAALDLARREEIVVFMRKAVPRLAKLADRFDQRVANTRPVVLRADQKPGDDIGGSFYWVEPFTCKDFRVMIYVTGIESAILGMLSLGIESGIYAIFSIVATMVYDNICEQPLEDF